MSYALFKEGSVWHYRFQVGRRRVQRSTRQTVKYRADEIAAKAYADALTWARGETPVPTLRELTGQWLEAHKQTASAAHLRAVEKFGRLHLYGMADVLVDEITTGMVEVARGLHLATHSRASANHWLNYLRLVCNWAIRRKVLPALPWQVKSLKVQKRPRVTLPVSVAWQWLEAVDAHGSPGVSVGVRLMFGLGLREAEALTARWEWVDWDRKTYTPGQTKGREADPIPMPDWLAAYLWERRGAGLIVARANGRPHAPGFARKAMRAANAACGIGNVTPHRLRGTFATLLSEAGTPIQTIQRVMRHKDWQTTMKYLEVNLGIAASGQQAVANRLGFAQSGGKVASTTSATRETPISKDEKQSSVSGEAAP